MKFVSGALHMDMMKRWHPRMKKYEDSLIEMFYLKGGEVPEKGDVVTAHRFWREVKDGVGSERVYF